MATSNNQKSVEERRQFPRIIVEYDTEANSNRGVILNMSRGGLFVATDEPFAVGTQVDITFPSLYGCPSFIVSGRVVWRKPKGIGIKFEELDKHQQKMINVIIQKVQ